MSFLTDELFTGVNWRGLERAIGRLLSHCGWQSVKLVGGKGDLGADILSVRIVKGKKKTFVTQVKAVTGANYVSSKAIDEAINALGAYKADAVIIATNGEFTQSAYQRRDILKKQGFDVFLWNGVSCRELLAKYPSKHSDNRDLRSYQAETVSEVMNSFKEGKKVGQFVVATGLGKTVIAAEIASLFSRLGMTRCLVLCHAQDLAQQLEQAFWSQTNKEVPTHLFFDGKPPKVFEGISFGLFQTFSSYVHSLEEDAYDLVIVDEAHHAMAGVFQTCLKALKPKYLLGMTATPWRGDGLSLSELFGPPLKQVSLVDGMTMGFLAEVDYHLFNDNINWEEIAKITGGSYSIRDLNRRLFLPQRDDAVVDTLMKFASHAEQPKVIIFCPSIDHSEKLSSTLSMTGKFICKNLSGLDKFERNKILMEFAAGKINAVSAVDVLNEGIDVPDVNTIVFLRATHSRRIFVQQLGRGLRLPQGKKKVLTVLDFVADIRRIAEVIKLDEEYTNSREKVESEKVILLKDKVVTFDSKGAVPFVKEWLKDVSDLADTDENVSLKFPGEVK